MAATASSYSITMRLYTDPDHAVVGQVATEIARHGGIVTAIDVADSSHERLTDDHADLLERFEEAEAKLLARYRRALAHDLPADVGLVLAANVADESVAAVRDGERVPLLAAVSVMLLAPAGRGRVSVTGPDPAAPPEIVLDMARHPDDVAALAEGTRLAHSLLTGPRMAPLLAETLLWTDKRVGDPARLRRSVAAFATPLWHPTGTAAMGPSADGRAVVDERLRVHGVSGLLVADGSVMPSPTRAPTNLTCAMIAERAASWMTA